MTQQKMDKVSAWAELERFAGAAGIHLDERAHPSWQPRPLRDDESEISDYDSLLAAIQDGRLEIDDIGGAKIVWRSGQPNGSDGLVLDPTKWNFSSAMIAFSGSVTSPAGRNGQAASGADSGNRICKLYLFLETLSDTPPGTLQNVRHRLDCQLILHLAQFLLSE